MVFASVLRAAAGCAALVLGQSNLDAQAVGAQPQGSLSGKIIYLHAGHGWTADNLAGGAWYTQRGESFEIVEDLANQDAMTMLAEELWRAGATIAPLRPIGHQPREVVLDNDDAEVEFVGAWYDSVSPIYFGDAGDVPYRYADTSPGETAHARYRPNLPEAGFYPVYTWVLPAGNRVEQVYRIAHSGGVTEVTVDHGKVGGGPVYLGTFHFEQGAGGYVEVSNRNDQIGVVIADMIRFGNGMGDIDRGGGASGQAREDEAGLYWVQWHVEHSQGIPEWEYRTAADDGAATVSLAPRYAEYMNFESVGLMTDRVFVSYHSNAGGSRGVIGLYNGNNDPASATPNQFELAHTIATEINEDLETQDGNFEHDWFYRTVVTLDRSDFEFGEINNYHINDEFDATIIETGFHDDQLDAELLRDPRVRRALARATYQGIVRYFHEFDGGATPLEFQPGPVKAARAEVVDVGAVRLSWTPPIDDDVLGDAPTGYRISISPDGYGFAESVFVPGRDTASHTLTGLDPAAGAHYFRIAAVNDAGESPPSPVLAAVPRDAATRLLIVDGFDRLDRWMNPRQAYFGGFIDRVRPRFSNSYDYAVQVGEAIEASGRDLIVDTTDNDALTAGAVDLLDYDAVVWILGEESSVNDTFDDVEQILVANYLVSGGDLFVSGTEIGWELDYLNDGRSFYNDTLRADYLADDAATYSVAGAPGSIFAGLSLDFDDGSRYYDAEYPDVIAPLDGAATAMTYVGGTGGGAALQHRGAADEGDLVMLAFPFETILGEANRAAVMHAALEFFQLPACPGDLDGDGNTDQADLGILLGAYGASPDGDLDGDGDTDQADLGLLLADYGCDGS